MDDFWVGGLALAERGVPAPSEHADAHALQRLAAWQEPYGPDGDRLLAARLADLGLAPDTLLRLLTEPRSAVAARTTAPAWARVAQPEAADDVPAAVTGDWIDAFADVFAPFLHDADNRLAASGPAELIDEAAIRAQFRRSLATRVARAAARSLVVDLDAERAAGRLRGATPRERFADFARRAAADRSRLVRRRPVLARIVADLCRYAGDATAETLRRYAADRKQLITTFFAGADPGPLVSCESGLGDRHQGGRTVAVLRFASGGRVIYKPRPPAAHRHFNELVAWAADRLPYAPRTLTLIDRGDYGWTEFVAATPCADPAGLRRFHHRQGVLLALLYALDGADIHLENVIACADQPVLVDVETLFHPHLPAAGETGDPAAAALAASVHRCSLLPQLMLGDADAVDISGIGGGGEVPMPVARWEAAGTDRMRLVRRVGGRMHSDNLPDGDGGGAARHADAVVAGFRAAYDLIAAHREELLAPDGPITRLAGDRMRFVARPTRLYLTLLDESTHPAVLGDALDRDRVFDVLGAGSVGDPVRGRLVRHECAELWTGDVPTFWLRPRETSLVSGQGEVIADVFPRSPLTEVAAKLRRMGDVDRRDQEWVIRAALATRLPHARHDAGVPEPRPYPMASPGPDRLLAAARGLADQILACGYHDTERVNWLGLEPLDDRHWAVMPLGAALGTGYTGVALFLAQLASLTGDTRYARTARLALRNLPPLLDRLAAGPDLAGIVGCGGFAGFGGIAYATAQVAVLLGDAAAAGLAERAVQLAGAALDETTADGVVDGTAGCLAAALAVHQSIGSAAARTLADAAARRLLASGSTGDGPGFASGRAGVGWALCRYADTVDDAAIRSRGGELLRAAAAAVSDDSWCQGTPGVALALLDVPAAVAGWSGDFVGTAVGQATARGALAGHSLCHGELGRQELLELAAPTSPEARSARGARAGLALSAVELTGPQCGTPGRVPDPGLLDGLAGIGHGLLRRARPESVPPVLLLRTAQTPSSSTPI